MTMLKYSLRSQVGFTLVELAIVLAMVGILSMGALFGVSEFRSMQSVKEGGDKINDLRERLLVFGQVNKFLPCPDTNFDGFEDRNGVACQANVGTAPYIDLGLQRKDVQDAWGNFIRYAVNRNVNNAALICDKRESASYFCRSGFNVNWFTFTETPPLTNNRGGGNYFVCNEALNTCDATSVLNPINLDSESASIVLVAYNEDGFNVLLGCAGMAGVSLENCDIDEFYQQRVKSSVDGDFYDDVVLSISGYEIKKAILGQSIAWDSFPAIAGNVALAPTYEDFDITAADNASDIETSGDDVIFARRNVDTDLNLGAGDDYISVGNDLNADLITGDGDDAVYIVRKANANILLGEGNDRLVLEEDLINLLDADNGNDHIWIRGDVKSSATFTLGAGDDVVWLGKGSENYEPSSGGDLEAVVYGGVGYDILVLENMTKSDWMANGIFQSYVNGFELIIFSADGSGNREYLELP